MVHMYNTWLWPGVLFTLRSRSGSGGMVAGSKSSPADVYLLGRSSGKRSTYSEKEEEKVKGHASCNDH